MLDEYLSGLIQADPEIPLEGLEADVWAAVERAEGMRHAYRVIASWQLAAMLAVLLGSAAVGAATAVSVSPQPRTLDQAAYDLAPVTLLLGRDSQ